MANGGKLIEMLLLLCFKSQVVLGFISHDNSED